MVCQVVSYLLHVKFSRSLLKISPHLSQHKTKEVMTTNDMNTDCFANAIAHLQKGQKVLLQHSHEPGYLSEKSQWDGKYHLAYIVEGYNATNNRCKVLWKRGGYSRIEFYTLSSPNQVMALSEKEMTSMPVQIEDDENGQIYYSAKIVDLCLNRSDLSQRQGEVLIRWDRGDESYVCISQVSVGCRERKRKSDHGSVVIKRRTKKNVSASRDEYKAKKVSQPKRSQSKKTKVTGYTLPTAKTRKQSSEHQAPQSAIHNCKIMLEDPSMLPDYEIELYWKKEKQWWPLDRLTTIHKFWYSSDEGGKCIASWRVRKNIKCKWRKMEDENNYDEEEESESESESESADEVAPKDQPTESSDNGESVTFTADELSDDETDTAEETDLSCEPPSRAAPRSDSWWESLGWEDDSDEEEDDSADEDYKPNSTKRQRNIRPCDDTEAMFGENKVVKGRVYERIVNGDRWLVKVTGFTDERFPARHARCQTLCYLHAAVQDCFPRADTDCIRQDRRIVFNESIRGKHFMETLAATAEDFDNLCQYAEFDIKRGVDRKDELIIELRRRQLQDALHPASSEPPKELVLFAGIGGCSIGDREAGFDIRWLVEWDPLAAASLKQDHPDATIYSEDVSKFLDKCQQGCPGYPSRGVVGHLQSSPPCNGFSGINRGGANDEYNNSLSFQTVRATSILQPKTGGMENVPGLLYKKNIHYAIDILQGLIELDYSVRIAVHNCCHFGTPQKRERVIFTFARKDVRFPDMPIKTHQERGAVTLGDAIHDLQSIPCETTGSGIVKLTSGKLTYNHVASAERKNPCNQRKRQIENICLDTPIHAMTTQNSVFPNPLRPERTLSIRELARLFDLPDEKQLFGSYSAVRKQIGNSVPVKLAKAIATPILAVHQERAECSGN